METTVKQDAKQEFSFNSQIRCDNSDCGAEARYVALFPKGGMLAFCGHHSQKHRDAIERAHPEVNVVENPL